MIKKKNSRHQTYQDGWGTAWKTVDRKLVSVRQQTIHFQEQTVGERRYWDAYVAGTVINRAVKVPYNSKIEQGDIFIIEGKQYEVVQKDLKDDRLPPSWMLSLKSAQIGYRGSENGK
ncbi:phage head closure protein [Bariatricus sp. SGI.161]|uniref:phage head closure protein n=1 Tax=Bariatricus sp. SGI.161 TaxID=3420550 RepID=UPI003CFEFF16